MKRCAIICGLVASVWLYALAGCRQTTSPSVPKVAIERAADTKIEDAGNDSDVGK